MLRWATMAEPPELWAFIASNLLVLLMGGTMTVLSWQAYRRNTDRASLVWAVGGFGMITFGTLVEAIYELGIRGSYELGGRELLTLHTVEGVLIALGLGALFYSLRQY